MQRRNIISVNDVLHIRLAVKGRQDWSLHTKYQWFRVGRIHDQNLTVDSFHTLSGNEYLVSYPTSDNLLFNHDMFG